MSTWPCAAATVTSRNMHHLLLSCLLVTYLMTVLRDSIREGIHHTNLAGDHQELSKGENNCPPGVVPPSSGLQPSRRHRRAEGDQQDVPATMLVQCFSWQQGDLSFPFHETTRGAISKATAFTQQQQQQPSLSSPAQQPPRRELQS